MSSNIVRTNKRDRESSVISTSKTLSKPPVKLGRMHIDSIQWKGDSMGFHAGLGRVYFSSFSVFGKSFEMGDVLCCGHEIFRIVGVFQATASFVGKWNKKHEKEEIQKQGHPYMLVVPLWLRNGNELVLPSSTKWHDGGHIDALPHWLGEQNVAKMEKLSVCVGTRDEPMDKKLQFFCTHALVCSRNGMKQDFVPLTNKQHSLLTCGPQELLEHHVAKDWNPCFRATRVRFVHESKYSGELPLYYTADSSDDDDESGDDHPETGSVSSLPEDTARKFPADDATGTTAGVTSKTVKKTNPTFSRNKRAANPVIESPDKNAGNDGQTTSNPSLRRERVIRTQKRATDTSQTNPPEDCISTERTDRVTSDRHGTQEKKGENRRRKSVSFSTDDQVIDIPRVNGTSSPPRQGRGRNRPVAKGKTALQDLQRDASHQNPKSEERQSAVTTRRKKRKKRKSKAGYSLDAAALDISE